MVSYALRYQAFTYSGSNGAEVLEFLDGADSRVWEVVSEDSTQITVEGNLTSEPDTRRITVSTGEILMTQVTPGSTHLSGPWAPEQFAQMFCEIPDAETLATAAEVDTLADRVAALENPA